jgi:menaquinone-dependent protoporphyrinogen oxidase
MFINRVHNRRAVVVGVLLAESRMRKHMMFVASEPNMPHLLVTYATEFGSTYEIAQRIATVLRQEGVRADLRVIMDVDHVEVYDAVIIGSAIYNGAWLPEATAFVQQFETQLARIPVAFFAVSMTMRTDTPEHRQTVVSYLRQTLEAAPRVQPVSIGLFGGRLRYRNLPLITRIQFWLRTRLPAGDFRDRRAVDDWVTQIQPMLLGA